jgi:hypothetical protein
MQLTSTALAARLIWCHFNVIHPEVPRKNVDCMVGTGGGLAAIGPLYTVVSVRQTKDPLLQETTTWLTCMKEGDDKELDGNAMFEDLNNQVCYLGFCIHFILNLSFLGTP